MAAGVASRLLAVDSRMRDPWFDQALAVVGDDAGSMMNFGMDGLFGNRFGISFEMGDEEMCQQ